MDFIIIQQLHINVIFRVTETQTERDENISTEGEPPAKASRAR